MGAEQKASPLCLLGSREREQKPCQSEPHSASDVLWQEAEESRGLASSAGVRERLRDFVSNVVTRNWRWHGRNLKCVRSVCRAAGASAMGENGPLSPREGLWCHLGMDGAQVLPAAGIQMLSPTQLVAAHSPAEQFLSPE